MCISTYLPEKLALLVVTWSRRVRAHRALQLRALGWLATLKPALLGSVDEIKLGCHSALLSYRDISLATVADSLSTEKMR